MKANTNCEGAHGGQKDVAQMATGQRAARHAGMAGTADRVSTWAKHRESPSGLARILTRFSARAHARVFVHVIAGALHGTAGALACGAILLASPVVHADDENPETLIRQGVQLRKKGQNEKAHGYFQRAYELGHTSRAAAQLGLCDVTLGQWQEANVLLTEALSSTDPWVEANRAAVEKGRTLARGHLGSVSLSHLPEGSSASVGNQPAANVSEGAVLWAPPGGASVRIQAEGYKVFEQEIAFEVGKTAELRAELQALPKAPPVVARKVVPADAHGNSPASHGDPGTHGPGSQNGPEKNGPQQNLPPRPSPEDEHTRQAVRLGSYIAGGLGVAALGTGAVLWRTGVRRADAIEAAGPMGTDRAYDPANGNYQTLEQTGVGLMIGGGAVLVSGVVAFLLTSPDESEKEKSTRNSAVSLSFASSAQAWHMGLSGAF